MLLRYLGVGNFARTDISHGFGGRFTKRFILRSIPRAYGLILRFGIILRKLNIPFDISKFIVNGQRRLEEITVIW